MNYKGKLQSKLPPVKPTLLDKLVQYVSPAMAIARYKNRAQLNVLEENGFIAGGSAKRTMKSWNPAIGQSADADTLPKLDSMRASSRDLYMSAPIATAAVRRARTNVIGYGLTLQSHIRPEILGMTEEQAAEWERNTELEFAIWSESPDCDASRELAFADLQGLAYMSVLLSGDCFVLLPTIKRANQIVDLRVQLIEADYCCNPGLSFDTSKIAGGIEVDDFGAPLRYHFRKSISPFMYGSASVADKWYNVEAYGALTGRKNVLHLKDKERPGQRRGLPMLAPVIEELKQITRISKAELEATLINSMFTVFVVSGVSGTPALQSGYIPQSLATENTTNPSIVNENDETETEKNYELGPGSVVEMDTGDDIRMADPKRPNVNFEAFFLAMVKEIGAALEIPFEQLMLHFSSSYSAARGALLEAWKFYRMRRVWMARYFCQPIYEEWLEESILKGRISAPGFFDDPKLRMAWCNASWGGPGQGYINPMEETQAALLAIEGNLSSHEDEFAAKNISTGTWEETINRKASEKGILEKKGLSLYSKGSSSPMDKSQADKKDKEEQDSADNKGKGENPFPKKQGEEE